MTFVFWLTLNLLKLGFAGDVCYEGVCPTEDITNAAETKCICSCTRNSWLVSFRCSWVNLVLRTLSLWFFHDFVSFWSWCSNLVCCLMMKITGSLNIVAILTVNKNLKKNWQKICFRSLVFVKITLCLSLWWYCSLLWLFKV